MSEGVYVPPMPPPPPPPPPAGPVRPLGYDFGKPFTFLFEDPNWIPKILIGGLFYLLGALIVGWFFILGYCAQLARNVISGVDHPLPEWEDLGTYFSEGLALFAVAFVYMLPLFVIGLSFVIPAMVMGSSHNEGLEALGSGMLGCMTCLIVPLSLMVALVLPSAMLRAVVHRRFGAAFEMTEVWGLEFVPW